MLFWVALQSITSQKQVLHKRASNEVHRLGEVAEKSPGKQQKTTARFREMTIFRGDKTMCGPPVMDVMGWLTHIYSYNDCKPDFKTSLELIFATYRGGPTLYTNIASH